MAVDMYMKIGAGIDGESTDDAHTDWIEISSYNHGVTQPVSDASFTGGMTGGRADFQDISITKVLDKATPLLNIACCKGTHIPEITLELCLATGDKHVFMAYTFTDSVITSVSAGASSGAMEIRPLETVTIAYSKIKWEYTPIDATGSPGSPDDKTWNLATNKQD
jgi:type VI secretion system secreted protein Hcp